VQARDWKGNVTGRFDTRTNIRVFTRTLSPGPILYIVEPLIAGFQFLGTTLNPEIRPLPPGIPLRFRWEANIDRYSGEIEGYRFGWDVTDLSTWDDPFDRDLTEAPEVVFSAGIHTLVVEAKDLSGALTRGRIAVEVIWWPSDRDLLWVDDLLDAYDLAVHRIDVTAGGVYNLGGGPGFTLSVWAEFGPLLEAATGSAIDITFEDWRPGDQKTFVSDISRFSEAAGWRPRVAPKEGIRRLADWVATNRRLFD